MMIFWFTLADGMLLGYLLGRVRPYQCLYDATWSRAMGWQGTLHLRFWTVLWVLTNPGKALNVWRKRNEPRPEPVSMLTLNPDFFTPEKADSHA